MSNPLDGLNTDVEIRPGGGVEDRLATDIAIALERMGIRGKWATEEGDGRSTYEVESRGNVVHVHVDLVRAE